jgi:hypothetical protein
MSASGNRRWIVAAFREHQPEKVWQVGIFKDKADAQIRANQYDATNKYHGEEDIITVIFEAEIVETIQ